MNLHPKSLQPARNLWTQNCSPAWSPHRLSPQRRNWKSVMLRPQRQRIGLHRRDQRAATPQCSSSRSRPFPCKIGNTSPLLSHMQPNERIPICEERLPTVETRRTSRSRSSLLLLLNLRLASIAYRRPGRPMQVEVHRHHHGSLPGDSAFHRMLQKGRALLDRQETSQSGAIKSMLIAL